MKKSLFVIQIFLPLEPYDRLRHRLHELVRQSPSDATVDEKSRLYGKLVAELTAAESRFLRGNWDYTNMSAQAEREHEDWRTGTPNDANERLAHAQADAGSGGPRAFFVTLLFLLRRGSRADLFMEQQTTMRPERLWRRDTFTHLLEAVGRLDFGSVVSDSAFVCPGADELGLSEDELAADRFAYLHKIV